MEPRLISYGGGVQSTALVVLAANGIIDYQLAVFSNVGDDSEHPDTIDYVRRIAVPWAENHGIEIIETGRRTRKGDSVTLWQQMMREDSRSIPIPVRMSGNGAPGRRSCTVDFKIKVIDRFLRERGATKEKPGIVAIGISTDEIHRIARKRASDYEIPVYPLIDLGLSRQDCAQIIRDAGLPVPPKSSCFFCPFHRTITWQEMRRDSPDLFERSCHLEDEMNKRRANLNRDPVYLTRLGAPLREVITEAQASLFDEDGPEHCDSGHCWT